MHVTGAGLFGSLIATHAMQDVCLPCSCCSFDNVGPHCRRKRCRQNDQHDGEAAKKLHIDYLEQDELQIQGQGAFTCVSTKT